MKKNILYVPLLSICTILLFKNNLEIHTAIIDACTLFITKLFPSLFPMMILCDLFIYFDLPSLFAKIFGSFWVKIFHTSPYGAFLFFLSSFSGSPSNAYAISSLHKEGKIDAGEASHILGFSFFSNPLFLYTMLSLIFPNDLSTVLKLILLPYFLNLFIAFLTRKKTYTFTEIPPKEKENFGNFLSNSIKKAMNTLLFILGSISVFFIINEMINPLNTPLLSGTLEISQGLNSLIKANISNEAKELLAITFISFGGLSIHLQIKGILSDTNISYKTFFIYRIFETILGIIFIFLI